MRAFAELLVTEPDPSAPAAMAAWVRSRGEVQAALDGVALGAVGAFDSSLAWAADGARSAGAWIVSNTGSAKAAADAGVRTARLARRTPLVAAAAAEGLLTGDHVFWLTRARQDDVAELFDRDEAALVDQARQLTVDALRVRLAAWRLRALEELGRNEPDGGPPLPEGEKDRLNLHEGIGGRGLLDGELDPASRALLFGAVAAEIDAWFRDGRLVDDDRPRSELNARALLDLVAKGSAGTTEHGAPRPLLIALADVATLADLGIDLDLDVDHLLDTLRHHQAATEGAAPSDATDPPIDDDADPGQAGDGPHDGPIDATTATTATTGTTEPDDGPDDDDEPPEPGRPDHGPPGGGPPGPPPGPCEPQPPPPRPPERRCEIVGVGPIPVTRLAELLGQPVDVSPVLVAADGTPLLVGRHRRVGLGPPPEPPPAAGGTLALLERPRRALPRPRTRVPLVPVPLDLGRSRRLASAGQWRALLVRSAGRCEIPGCTAPSTHGHAHHVTYWERGGPTDLANLLVVCTHHHGLLHAGFSVASGLDAGRLRRPDGSFVAVPFRDRVRR